ncbi:MAG: tRNA pseudouridine(55) synthase TruB [Bacteroidia bacterium]|nr:tRNA pseudouridine(55) synthase TruB [Bacteroidia bacterium]NNM15039.1 tRNA pseudouridine(55) synthase TruB [Bacteroidia bacterium]
MYDFITGEVLLIDKPIGWTSFDVVNKIRYACRAKKVGHAGTLDPMATGLLIICTGKKTKEINSYQDLDKEYVATLVLGATRPSIDMETEIDETFSVDGITEEKIRTAIQKFIGKIMQSPPAHSAIKVDGERAYNLARKGLKPKMREREVEIKAIELLKSDIPEVVIKINCAKGTYVRSLVRDIGKELGCGAYLKTLVRTKIGDFSVEKADSIDEFIDNCKQHIKNQDIRQE